MKTPPSQDLIEDIVLMVDLVRRLYSAPEAARGLPLFHGNKSAWVVAFCREAARGTFGDVTPVQRQRLLQLSGEAMSKPTPVPEVKYGRPPKDDADIERE